MTAGEGLWPAFWMLGSNISQIGWPSCGEIDVMEQIGKERNIVHGTLHGPGYSGAHGMSAEYRLHSGRFSEHFHLFRVEWRPNSLKFFVDGHLYSLAARGGNPAGSAWVFDHPFNIILNLAVGGDWPGNPTRSTVFPNSMIVDWVRVWQRSKPE